MAAFTQFEGQILLWIQENLRGALDAPVRFITRLGDHGLIWIALILLLLCFRKTRRAAVTAGLAMLLTLLMVNLLIKPLAARTRPYEVIDGLRCIVAREKDFSFPSGHSAHAFACAWALWRSAPRKIGLPALILAALIALSRLYVGVHFPSDVVCGSLAGLLLAQASVQLLKRLPQKTHKG